MIVPVATCTGVYINLLSSKQYCGSDVRQLKRIRDVRPLNVDTVVCSLNATVFTLFTSLEKSLLQSFLANLPNRYSALYWRPVTHAQTWASYSALYQFGRLSSFFVWRLYGYRDRTVDDASCCIITVGRSLNLPTCTLVSTQSWTFFVTEASRRVIDECRYVML